MRDFTEHDLTEAVLQQLEKTPDKRLKQIMRSLITHLHAFVREVNLTEEEWFQGIKFLTETGQTCDDSRQECVLLSDTLGVSILVDAINHRALTGATESTILGPFYRHGAPEMTAGASIAGDTPGEPTFVSGRVTDLDGKPIAGALLDVWQASPSGLYETQDPTQPEFNLRGKFKTDAHGCYAFRTVKGASYPIPLDGPVGKMMKALGRQPYRPAHIHFIVSAKGYETLTTHVFIAGDPCLDADPVFAVKSSLVADFIRHDSVGEAKARQTTAPFYTVEYDFTLKAAL
jgi:catechol 1,2-dioxygenase